jgi:pilus assembly protein Flp/PilA
MNTMLLKMYLKAQNLKDLMKDDEGQDLVEYALLVALLSLAAVASITALGGKIQNIFNGIGNALV